MNAPNETLPPRQRALPEAWIEKVFSRMEGLYGSLFLDRWKNSDMANVRRVWAEELAGFQDQPEMIGHALKALSNAPFPPTLPEFLALCRAAPRPQRIAIEGPQLSADEQRERAEKMAAAAKKPAAFDFIGWAKKPGSAMAMAAVVECAGKGDERFVEIVAEHKANGVCDEHGKLLRRWDASRSDWAAA